MVCSYVTNPFKDSCQQQPGYLRLNGHVHLIYLVYVICYFIEIASLSLNILPEI